MPAMDQGSTRTGASRMTPDTRTTENPEPRTEAGRNFLARAGLLHYEEDIEASDQIMAAVLAIEAETAQGAAPRAEGLDVRCRFVGGLDGHTNCVPHGWAGYREEVKTIRVCPDAAARLAPQDRRDKEGTE